MNDLAKESISEKFLSLINLSKMKKAEAARMIGIHVANLYNIQNRDRWGDVSDGLWRYCQKVVNSGERLEVFVEKCGPYKKTRGNAAASNCEDRPEDSLEGFAELIKGLKDLNLNIDVKIHITHG